jgi:hypothetical protein
LDNLPPINLWSIAELMSVPLAEPYKIKQNPIREQTQ